MVTDHPVAFDGSYVWGANSLALKTSGITRDIWVLFGAGVRSSGARAAVAACMVAMIVHSIGYAGFAIDPATWALLALGVGLHPGVRPEPE